MAKNNKRRNDSKRKRGDKKVKAGRKHASLKRKTAAQKESLTADLIGRLNEAINPGSEISANQLNLFIIESFETHCQLLVQKAVIHGVKLDSNKKIKERYDQLNKHLKKAFEQALSNAEKYHSLFANIVASGLQAKFERMITDLSRTYLPDATLVKYIWWVRAQPDLDFANEDFKTTQTFILDENELLQGRGQIIDLQSLDKDGHEQVAHIRILMEPGAKIVEKDFEALRSNCATVEEFIQITFTANGKQISKAQGIPIFEKARADLKKIVSIAFMSEQDYYNLFENMMESGLQEHFENLLIDTNRSWLPEETIEHYVQWMNSKGLDHSHVKSEGLKTAITRALEDIEAKETSPITEEIEVAGQLVEGGVASDEMLPRNGLVEEDQHAERKEVPHIPWLVEGIQSHFGDRLEGTIKIYRPRWPEGKKPEDDLSLCILHFETRNNDGTTTVHQIATNNWYGGGTYIFKEPVEINESAPRLVKIGDMLRDGHAWPIKCVNKDQYIQKAIEMCEANKDKLTPYITRLSWRDKKDDLMKSVYAYICATGQLPKTSNENPVGFGALYGLTTWRRAAGALNNGSIKGLENVRNFQMLSEYMKDNGYPDLDDHIDKPTLNARALFNDAAQMIKETGVAPQEVILDDKIELAGHKGSNIAAFFEGKARGISHIEDVVNLHRHRWPKTFDDFMIASGLAVRNGEELEPALQAQAALA